MLEKFGGRLQARGDTSKSTVSTLLNVLSKFSIIIGHLVSMDA